MSPTTTQADQAAQVLALVQAQAATRESLTAQADAMAAASATQFKGWYSTAAVTAWAASTAAQVESLQRALAQSTDAYLARVMSLMTGRRVRPVGRVDVTDLRTGVTHPGAYGRAADTYRWQQARLDQYARNLPNMPNPTPPDLVSPVDAAAERVRAAADMDMQLADRAQTRKSYEEADSRGIITGYRRVIHPEMSKGGPCGLCVAASDRLYGAKELKPIHDRCKCTTMPVFNFADPGSTLNEGDLGRLYHEGGSTNRADLKATRYTVTEHGELGPLLNKQGVPTRTETRARRDTNRRPSAPKSPAERIQQIQTLQDSLQPSLTYVQGLAKDNPDMWSDYAHELEERIAFLGQQLAA